MKTVGNKRKFFSMAVVGISLCALAAFSRASTASTTSTSVNIVNNSNSEIRNVYLSHVDVDDWGANQLAEGATIAPGASSALNNLVCDQQQVKVIAEDSDGCFLSTVVTCGNSSTWTITNDTAKDCGGG
jgi:hypothetical protein